ncbi:hypothetical protein ACFQH5_20125 [Halomonas salifodinae]|uniref:Uncharacterized protein n=1 Tax=Halomonas salifodinae TaxID=438745 RepID=A0ABW2F5M7_9GAMM
MQNFNFPKGVHVNRVRLATNEYANPDGSWRRVDQIEVHMMDMWLRKSITCARDEYLAQRLADEAGVELENYLEGDNAPPPLTPEEQEEFAESLRPFIDE